MLSVGTRDMPGWLASRLLYSSAFLVGVGVLVVLLLLFFVGVKLS
jgi:hypothetical protein